MKTRLIVTCRAPEGGAATVKFALAPQGFVQDLGDMSLADFAKTNGFVRHESFDFAVGDAGRTCALFELVGVQPEVAQLALIIGKHSVGVRWMSFPEAAKALKEGGDRRFLQLVVQYLSTAGIDDSVIAADYDQAFLTELKGHLPTQ